MHLAFALLVPYEKYVLRAGGIEVSGYNYIHGYARYG